MKVPAHVESTEDIVHWGLDAITKERHRRLERYGEISDAITGEGMPLSDRLLDLLPLFRMTHSQRRRECFECGQRIAPYEIHFVMDGSYLCQRNCMEKRPPSLRLIRGGVPEGAAS
jgi:hypothetical protein